MVRALVDLLVPPCCDGCGRPAQPPWCAACHREVVRARPPGACRLCADGDGPGHRCWRPPAPVDGLVVVGPWRGGVARAVTRAKLEGRTEVLVAAGAVLGGEVAAAGEIVDVVVAVPSDRRRVRLRGGDHTRALARGVVARLDTPLATPFARVRGTPDRVAAGGRTTMGAGGAPTPRVVRPSAVRGRRVLLVDDVVTTGTTLGGAAGALTDAGAVAVVGAAVGRALGHVLGGPAVAG